MFFSAWASSLRHGPCFFLSIFFLHFLPPMMDSSHSCSCRYDLKLVRMLLLLDFCSSFHIFSGRREERHWREQGSEKTVPSVIGKSVRRKEPLLLPRMQLWRSLSANSATTAMPCEGHSLLQLAAEILPTLNLSTTSYQCVIALIKLSTPKVS